MLYEINTSSKLKVRCMQVEMHSRLDRAGQPNTNDSIEVKQFDLINN